ncbi:conjugal transfer protein TrbE [Caulobacter segnis]|uniref:CagE, TrbE, VirB component of type IV transporter system, conserved region n=2 Tax=Caulobacter segnis TaxID=88688 RepID=D5VKD2_CAUST|nr:conjugal transfer protein TrbE [Caulobacter segnis]ADG10955.1 CagE, TrbE, VirB component of type IV transporter system, conserved region [Caulobacter segnis ATCC 21756]AVQ02648.1 conjugal transfer protein TrbE [Caulobacter segnis]
MFDLREYRRRPSLLADYLPWVALVAPGVVLNKDGGFQRSAEFRGPDLDSATNAEVAAIAARLNGALRRLGSGWAIFVEARRDPAAAYPASVFPDPVSALVDAERRADFVDSGEHYESRFFLTLSYLPPAERRGRLERLFVEGRAGDALDWRAELAAFIDRTDRFLALLDGLMPSCSWLGDGETLGLLHGAVSTGRQRVAVPEIPIYLDSLLASQPLAGGLEPRLGGAHLRVLTIIGFPPATTPGLLDELNRLAFAYRWSTRALCLDKTQAVGALSKIRRQWFAKRKSVLALLREALTQEPSALVDNDAANKAGEADLALQDLGGDAVAYAYVTTSLVVWDDDPAQADAKLALAEKVIQGRELTVIRESVNAVEGWLGTLPGHVYANVRQPPLSTLNLAHLAPLSAVWAGPARNAHLDGPPLLIARTAGSTPFRLSLHVDDVGHTLVVGPTGAGKSVLLAMLALSFRRYPKAQLFAFDHGASSRAAVLAMGGAVHDLSGEAAAALSLQPLARIDLAEERAWASEWLAAILAREGVVMTPAVRQHLWAALGSLSGAPVAERTLTGLVALLASPPLKAALAPFVLGGPHGRLLDGASERLREGDLQVFETEGLARLAAAPAVLSYLFHRIERRLDGRPTLILIDEGWLALDDPAFGAQLREWLKTLRKKKASVVFATQSLADVTQSAIAATIIESCPTRIFLPNPRALEPQGAAAYARFGLNDRQIEILARATPARDYYLQSRVGNRLFDLGLGPVALAFCAASAKADQALIGALLSRHGQAGFAAAWLRAKRLAWAADLLPGGSAAPASLAPETSS